MIFVTKKVKPTRLKVDTILNELRKAQRAEAAKIRRELEKTVATWDDKPKFQQITDTSDGNFFIGFDTDSDVWRYLDQGTQIRWAVMSADWESKTQPRRRRARQGQGNVVIAGRRAMQQRNIQPRPGIEPRNWTEDITRERTKPYRRRMEKALKVGVRKARA